MQPIMLARTFATLDRMLDKLGTPIRERTLDSGSLGISHQARARELADQFGYTEPGLWTSGGRARSGRDAALVRSSDQVLSKPDNYQKMGIRAFILSGYTHIEEVRNFLSRVLPKMKTCSLPEAYGHVPVTPPATPLT